MQGILGAFKVLEGKFLHTFPGFHQLYFLSSGVCSLFDEFNCMSFAIS
jgi:hypothetical protein